MLVPQHRTPIGVQSFDLSTINIESLRDFGTLCLATLNLLPVNIRLALFLIPLNAVDILRVG
jgi:hypothetical protein